MIKLTLEASSDGKAIEMPFTEEEWNDLEEYDQTGIINEHLWSYVSVTLENEEGGCIDL